MRLPREDRYDLIEPLLPLVEKPSRYLDHEWGSLRDQEGPFHVCLLYPDTYEIGLSNLAIAMIALESDAFDTHDYIINLKELHSQQFEQLVESYAEKYKI